MANTSSAKKATRKIAARTAVNKNRRSRVRTFVRKVEEALASGDKAAAEAALKAALVEKLELKPRKAFAPVRVALTGSTVSPPLYESMELLGREKTLARLRAARATIS